jgi:bifunctional enzyme Fae/Hps
MNLNTPPYIQLAVDIPSISEVEVLFTKIVNTPPHRFLFEIGTPLLKNEGLKVTSSIFRKKFPANYIIADLKTLDVGKLEVSLAHKAKVNACVVSGLAPIATINSFIEECNELKIDSWVDTLGMNYDTLNAKLKIFSTFPDVLVIHRGIDEEISGKSSSWEIIKKVKESTPSLIATAGGLTLENIKDPQKMGSDIFIIGRAIYQSKNPQQQLESFFSAITN